MEEALPLYCFLQAARMHDPSALKLVTAGTNREENGADKDASHHTL